MELVADTWRNYLKPYFEICGAVFEEGLVSGQEVFDTTSHQLLVKIFGDRDYQNGCYDPLRKAIFTNEAQTFKHQCEVQKSVRGTPPAMNPRICSLKELVTLAKRELGIKFPKRKCTKNRLIQMVIDHRLRSEKKCVGIKESYNILVDEDHHFSITTMPKENGQTLLQLGYFVEKFEHVYENAFGMRREKIY